MGKGFTSWVLLFVACASVAWAGVLRVHGPVSGKWARGDSVVVERPGAYIPEDAELEVEPGVKITFEGLGRFEAYGRLTMRGEPNAPIQVTCSPGWRGFRLSGQYAWHVFEYMNITAQTGMPRQGIEVIGAAGFIIEHCSIEAYSGCMRVTGSALTARNNSFNAFGLYARAVELNDLQGFSSPDCDLAPGNIFRDNFLKVNVEALQPGDEIDPFAMTVGLRVDYSTNICLSFNEIVVHAPLTVVGTWFVNSPSTGEPRWQFDHSIVYSESSSRAAIGVLNEVQGTLEITRTTVTVQGVGGFISTCFYASRQAYILVNSTTTILGSPEDVYYNTSGVGQIDANYLVKWTIEGTNLDNGLVGGGSEIGGWALDNDELIHEGDSVWNVNPMFAQGTDWGTWNSSEEVHQFFTLTSISPCIDRGDPDGGHDPDYTRWDIGHDYYDQSSSPVDPRPGVISSSRMLAAYPNPFNPLTVMPIEVSGRGLLRVVVWDILGREVMERVLPIQQPGLQNVHFDAGLLSSGTYLAQAEFDGQIIGSQRLVLLK